MMNNKYYPFERNRYYYGKLLTTSDLEAEQQYLNGKRRFINKLMFGNGKICGLKVYNVSENTIMVESGFAIDDNGREIVVPQSEIKKLASIDGFDIVKSEKMLLTISYNETFTQPIYSVTQNGEGKEYEYNRIDEGYKLKLKSLKEQNNNIDNMEDKLIHNKEIYNDGNFKILIKMPTIASIKSEFKFVTIIEKLNDVKEAINLHYVMNIPGFVDDEGSEKISIDIDDSLIESDNIIIKETWLKPNNISEQDKTTFMVKKEDINVKVGEQTYNVNENILFQLKISNNEPIEIIKTIVKSESLEDVMKFNVQDEIVLAVINVIYTGSSCVIQDVDMPIESKYSPQMPSQSPYINKMLNYYEYTKKTENLNHQLKIVEADNKNADLDFAKRVNAVISSGTFEMPLGLNVKANKTILSDEIMHNLGPGDVCVSIGLEFVTAKKGQKGNFEKKIILGDPEVFKDDGIDLPSVSTATQVICERGTFIVGLKFAQTTSLVSVKVRWFAYKKYDEGVDSSKFSSEESRGIYVKQDTIKLVPNEIHFIEIGFKNMNPTAVRYEVVDNNGGEVDENGVYTAPNKDGVYEIKISCINEPSMYTFAYAIVMKKGEEQK